MGWKDWPYWLKGGLLGLLIGLLSSFLLFKSIKNQVFSIDGKTFVPDYISSMNITHALPNTISWVLLGLLFGIVYDTIQINKNGNWPKWLKGGLVLTIIYFILAGLTFFGGFLFLLFITFPGYLFFGLSGSFRFDGAIEFIPSIILSVIIYFIVGALLGWIYGKIKK